MWDQMCKALRFLVREVDLHMCGMFSKVVEDLFRGSAKHFMNLIDLVKFVVAGKQRAEREDLVHDAAYAPDIHLIAVVPVGEEALRCSVPSR
jgi:hypothetical protein